MSPNRATSLDGALDKLEAAYGCFVTPGDPVEAGVLALLASTAPSLANEASRDRIRHAFVDWNEARVADPWDITCALESSPNPEGRVFARAMLRFLDSVHTVLNRCSFDVPAGEPVPDWVASTDKMRGATPAVRAVCLAMVMPDAGWHATPEIVKAVQKLGTVGKTQSAQKIAAGLAEHCKPEDRLRAHYLLARYGARAKDDPDPLEDGEKKKSSSKAAASPKVAASPKTKV
ncbi:MAG: hypothetical protein K8T90_00350 [Planctomycetes bacterium]|nr:hypothetical protein [Planctomycetota bacterium]